MNYLGLKNIFFYSLPLWGGLGWGLPTFAQHSADEPALDKFVVTGSIQSDILIPQDDEAIGTKHVDEWGLTNTYVDINAQSKHIDAGIRAEFKRWPLPGYEVSEENPGYTKSSCYEGWGVPFIYVKGKWNTGDITLGSFYEQFGSGFILRTYEERALGIDNSLIGARVNLRPVKGVALKALTGTQRVNWTTSNSWMTGGDVELAIDEWMPALQKSNTHLTVGGSFLNKTEARDFDISTDPKELFSYYYNVPRSVNSWDARVNLQTGGLSILAEYAQKTQDPSFDNGYIYRPGRVAMLSASYSSKGFSLLAQAKRSDNMSNRSIRKRGGTAAFLNHLPAFTQDQTYALAALYPYATNSVGEWAYQGQLSYKFKRGTLLGGKYGTGVNVNYSFVTGIDRNVHKATDAEGNILPGYTDGYGSAFWKWSGGIYYQDINVAIDKKFTKDFTLKAMYMNQAYNEAAVKGHGDLIRSNIFVLDGKYRFSSKTTLRMEAQYLTTGEDQGDWVYGLAELSLLPHFMLTVSDMYNAGDTKYHYYLGGVTYNTGSHRLMVSYGRTRAGFNCSGGVCRWIPATKGVNISYNYNF